MRDNLRPEGARDLAKRITAYWHSQGVMIRMRVVRLKFTGDNKAIPSNMWSLRSNLGFDSQGNPYVKDRMTAYPPEDKP